MLQAGLFGRGLKHEAQSDHLGPPAVQQQIYSAELSSEFAMTAILHTIR